MTTEITRILNGFKQFSENPYEDSINFLREYIEVEPSSEAFFKLGKALFFNEEYDESIEYLKKSELSKSNAYLGLVYFKKEEYKTAIKHFNLFVKDNQNETILTYLMLSHEKESNWENAIGCGERLLEINPDNSSIKIRLIDYHLNNREFERSLEYIDELNNKKLKYKRGVVLFSLKRYEEAIRELRNMKIAEAYRLIGRSYERLKKPSKAIRYLLKAYEEDPNIEILFEISEISFKTQNHSRSIHFLEKVLELEPGNEKALEKIARNYYELQKFEFTITYCEELLNVNEENFNAYLILSETYSCLGNFEKSLELIERGLAINPKSPALWVQKAWVHYPSDFEDFVRDYEHALKLEPNNTKNYTKLIWYCALEDRQDYAHKFYEKLLFYNPAFEKSFEEVTEYADCK